MTLNIEIKLTGPAASGKTIYADRLKAFFIRMKEGFPEFNVNVSIEEKQEIKSSDAYQKALPNEPTFTLLARDTTAPSLVRLWAATRSADIMHGFKPLDDLDKTLEARAIADAMEKWRAENDGAWRNTPLAMAANAE